MRVGEHVAAADVEIVLEPDRHGERRNGQLDRAVGGLDCATQDRRPDGRTTTSSPARQTPEAHLAACTRDSRATSAIGRITHCTGKRRSSIQGRRHDLDRLEVLEERRPS